MKRTVSILFAMVMMATVSAVTFETVTAEPAEAAAGCSGHGTPQIKNSYACVVVVPYGCMVGGIQSWCYHADLGKAPAAASNTVDVYVRNPQITQQWNWIGRAWSYTVPHYHADWDNRWSPYNHYYGYTEVRIRMQTPGGTVTNWYANISPQYA